MRPPESSPSATPARDALPLALCAAAGLLFFLALASPALDPAMQLYYRDTARLYYPVKQFIASELHHGRLPLWDPWTEAGTSLLAQVTPGLFHPLTLLYPLLPFECAFKLNHLLALPAAGLGAFLLARKLGASRGAALAASFIYGGSGYLVSIVATNLPYALGAATVPLALVAFLHLLERVSAARLFGASALLGLCMLAGEPESMLFAGVLGTSWAVARALALPERLRGVGRALALAAAWGALALALSGPASLPALARLRTSERAAGLSLHQRRAFALHPLRLAGLFIPQAFDDLERGPPVAFSQSFAELLSPGGSSFAMSIALGPPALFLLLLAPFAGRRGRLLTLGALLFALAATGDALGIEPLLQSLVPGLRLFRYSEKLIAPASLLFALAAALGADFALAPEARRARAWALAGLSGLCAALCLWVQPAALYDWVVETGATHQPQAAAAFLDSLARGLELAAQLCAMVCAIAIAKGARAASTSSTALLAACCAVAALVDSQGLLLTAPLDLFHAPVPLADELRARAGPSPRRWRLLSDSGEASPGRQLTPEEAVRNLRVGLEPQLEQLSGIEGIASYFSAPDSDYERALHQDPDDALFVLRGRFAELDARVLSSQVAARLGFSRALNGSWLRERPTAPEAFVVGGGEAAASVDSALAAMRAPAFDPMRAVLVLPAFAALVDGLPACAAPVDSTARVLHQGPSRASIEVDSSGGILILGDHFDPGWSATLDGAPALVGEIDLVALGVRVPAGRHRLELRFWPVGLGAGLCALAAALLSLALFALFVARAARSQP